MKRNGRKGLPAAGGVAVFLRNAASGRFSSMEAIRMADESDIQFKTQEEVGYRALALSALSYRLSADSLLHTDAEKRVRAAEVLAQVHKWIASHGIDAHLSTLERNTIAQPLGQIADDAFSTLIWRGQALAVLLWALQKINPMPTYAEAVSAAMLQPILQLGQPIAGFLK